MATIHIPDTHRTSSQHDRHLLAGLAASQGFTEPSDTDRIELAELHRCTDYVMDGIDRIVLGKAIPVLDSATGQISINPIGRVMTKAERKKFLNGMALPNFDPPLSFSEQWVLGDLCNDRLTEFQRSVIRYAATSGHTKSVPEADIQAIFEALAPHVKMAAVLTSVNGGNSYIRRGPDGQLVFEPVSNLSADDQKRYFELRERLGLHGRMTATLWAHSAEKVPSPRR